MVAPAPWTLTGNGLILAAHFPEAFVRAHGFLAPYQQTAYRGWLGMVILADYHTSNVGPYRELMFIPGLFRLGGKTAFSVSKIYVSSQDSINNGRRNWGIPKEYADFAICEQPNGVQQWRVSQEGEPFFSVEVRPGGLSFPVSTRFLPPFSLIQAADNELLRTAPTATGQGQFATLRHPESVAAHFPDISQGTYLTAVSIQKFTMTFPPATQL